MNVVIKPIVLIDMDDVLADFEGFVYAYLRQHHPEINQSRPRLNHYIYKDFDPEYSDIINAVSDKPDFFYNLPVVPGALDGWQKLLDLGYDPVICTSPMLSNDNCVAGKKTWIAKHLVPRFGPSVLERARITKQKHLVDALAIIDDRAVIPHTDEATWQHILFDTSYNQHITTPLRLRGWDDSRLGTFLNDCQQLRANRLDSSINED